MKIFYRDVPSHMEGSHCAVVDDNGDLVDDVVTIENVGNSAVILTHRTAHTGVEHFINVDEESFPGPPLRPKVFPPVKTFLTVDEAKVRFGDLQVASGRLGGTTFALAFAEGSDHTWMPVYNKDLELSGYERHLREEYSR